MPTRNVDPGVASARATAASLSRWAAVPDRVAATLPARQGRWGRYVKRARELAPDGATAEDIEYRAECLRRADMARMSLKAAKARSAKAAARRAGGQPDDENAA
jgi:hypothetical protein